MQLYLTLQQTQNEDLPTSQEKFPDHRGLVTGLLHRARKVLASWFNAAAQMVPPLAGRIHSRPMAYDKGDCGHKDREPRQSCVP
jgi:hypothetical protein